MKKNYDNIKRVLRAASFILALFSCKILTAQNGEFQWAAGYGGSLSESSSAITTDASGNSYTTGEFSGTVDFDPGPGVFNLGTTNGSKPYISVLDATGDLAWAAFFDCTNFGKSTDISLDGSGNVYTTGWFTGTMDFDPGTGTNNISSTWNSYDIYVSKLDAAGNYVWAKKIGETSNNTVIKNYADAAGNIYVTGLFNDPIDFDPGSGNVTITPTHTDEIFVFKLDAAGDFVWAKSFGGPNGCVYPDVHVDDFGSVYLSGSFKGTVDFNPGAGVFNQTATGSNFDMFITKLDNAGDFLWARRTGGSSWDYVNDLTSDAAGNIYTTGGFNGTVDFDPGAGVSNLVTGGPYNTFVQKLDASGNFVWASRLGGTSQVIARAIQVDALGNVYAFGDISGFTDFDPGPSVFNLGTNGGVDGFISKLSPSGDFVWAKNVGSSGLDRIVDGAVDLNGNVFATGDFQGTADFDPGTSVSNTVSNGNQDIFVVKLGCNPTTGVETVSACDSYVFNGVTYFASNNTATDTLLSSGGCDSIVTLDLTILNTTSGLDTRTECNSYTWIDGITYTTSNSSTTFTLVNAAGCDSILQLDLTIINIDATTTLIGDTIFANSTGSAYQWIDCTDSSIIAGATGASYLPMVDGDYAVILTEGNCVDTSDCVAVTLTSVGLTNIGQDNTAYPLYPNPTTAQVIISNFTESIDRISIYDITGKVLNSFKPNDDLIDLNLLENGIYFVKIQEGNKIYTQKIVKK